MTILYHYCSVDSFFNILKSKKIRLHNAYQMNDFLENKLVDRAFYEFLQKNLDRLGAEEANTLWREYEINKTLPFIFCMSEAKDLLSQWRSYADDGCGVAVGFNSDAFPVVDGVPGRNISSSMNTGLCQAIYYDHGNVESLIATVFDERYARSVTPEDASPLHEFPLWAARISPVFKNKYFHEEKEWRLIHSPLLMSNENNENIMHGTRYEINQMVSKGEIKTFFEYDFLSNVVSEIWLGPKCKISSFDLKMFLSINGYGALPCFSSEGSYR